MLLFALSVAVKHFQTWYLSLAAKVHRIITQDESNCKKRHLIEFKSSLSLNDSVINEFEYNVIDYLYGIIYGKATVK